LGGVNVKLSHIVNGLQLEHVTGSLDVDVEHGYVGDLLSDVMGNAQPDSVWVTVQSHANIVAVAAITGIRAIVLAGGHDFEEETVKKAEKEKISLLKSPDTSFQICGKLYELGLR